VFASSKDSSGFSADRSYSFYFCPDREQRLISYPYGA